MSAMATMSALASVGLRVSVSHDLGEIACTLMMLFADMLFYSQICYSQICYLWICYMRMGDSGDVAFCESHKYMDLAPVDGSSEP